MKTEEFCGTSLDDCFGLNCVACKKEMLKHEEWCEHNLTAKSQGLDGCYCSYNCFWMVFGCLWMVFG